MASLSFFLVIDPDEDLVPAEGLPGLFLLDADKRSQKTDKWFITKTVWDINQFGQKWPDAKKATTGVAFSGEKGGAASAFLQPVPERAVNPLIIKHGHMAQGG